MNDDDSLAETVRVSNTMRQVINREGLQPDIFNVFNRDVYDTDIRYPMSHYMFLLKYPKRRNNVMSSIQEVLSDAFPNDSITVSAFIASLSTATPLQIELLATALEPPSTPTANETVVPVTNTNGINSSDHTNASSITDDADVASDGSLMSASGSTSGNDDTSAYNGANTVGSAAQGSLNAVSVYTAATAATHIMGSTDSDTVRSEKTGNLVIEHVVSNGAADDGDDTIEYICFGCSIWRFLNKMFVY
eukprot:scaffold8419_cov62-Attheya_sp.AAC.18